MEVLREMREIKRIHKPVLIILLEPKISRKISIEVCRQLEKSHWIRLAAEGFSMDIWLLWDKDEIKIKPLYVHKYFVHVEVGSASEKR